MTTVNRLPAINIRSCFFENKQTMVFPWFVILKGWLHKFDGPTLDFNPPKKILVDKLKDNRENIFIVDFDIWIIKVAVLLIPC